MSIHKKLSNEIPQVRRGRCWCLQCGRMVSVNGADCLRHGWPECCGATMTIDSPGERHKMAAQREKENKS